MSLFCRLELVFIVVMDLERTSSSICTSQIRTGVYSCYVRRKLGIVCADVKSKPYEISDSSSKSVKFKDDEMIEIDAIPWFEEFPKRWIIVILCFSAFLLCNMDRVNMSIAILPMSVEYNWNPTTVGLIQSSFFWGYLLTQIAGGIWADTVGGKLVLTFGVVWWSVATILTPVAAKLGLPFLLVTRALMGIGEGVAMPAMNNLLSKWVPVAERSRSLALVYFAVRRSEHEVEMTKPVP